MTASEDIQLAFKKYFKGIFEESFVHQLDLDWTALYPPFELDLNILDAPFTFDEIKAAVFTFHGDKSLGPDGFTISFFQQQPGTLVFLGTMKTI